MFNHYLNPYNPQQFNAFQPQQNILPPQQIPQAKGKDSIDMLRMSPNSSVLIADETAPIVWKCVSDSLGNVSSEPYTITPCEKTDEPLTRLEKRVENIEQILSTLSNKPHDTNENQKKQGKNIPNGV